MMYPVVEIFQSIQGEGRWTGYPVNFVRLAGCPNHCKFCDTDKVATFNATETAIANLIDERLPITVITGGEPTIYDLSPLVAAIRSKNILHRLHLETSGVEKIHMGFFDWISLSPKPGTRVMRGNAALADEIKWLYPTYSIDKIRKYNRMGVIKPRCLQYLQPVNYRTKLNHKNIQAAVKEILRSPFPFSLELSIQLHKVIHVR